MLVRGSERVAASWKMTRLSACSANSTIKNAHSSIVLRFANEKSYKMATKWRMQREGMPRDARHVKPLISFQAVKYAVCDQEIPRSSEADYPYDVWHRCGRV